MTDAIGSRLLRFAFAAPLSFVVCYAFAGDFPELRNSESDVNATPMNAAEVALKMELPKGFKATLFASEPQVQNPIAMAWDAGGRFWVAENFTYAEAQQRFDLSFRDRVLVLEDLDGDGVSDKRTVFTDQVQMLTSVEVGHGGVWLMCPPQVLFIPDANQDLVPDGPAQVALDGFTVAESNYHNYANGLRFGPDGWLYGRCGASCPGLIGRPGTLDKDRFALEGGIWRYHPIRKTVEVLCAGTTNPWGHDWNEFGDLFFINTVNGHFWHAIPGAHYNRPFNLDPNPQTYQTIDQHADHYHFDTGKSWTQSRDGAANSLGGGHAHCGAMFYIGEGWPKAYRGKFFTSNFHGRRLNQETVSREGSGYLASHDPDFCIVPDPFYRGMDLSVGPDGGVMLIDWSDTGECHERNGVHRTSGRIFKITHQDHPSTSKIASVDSLSNQELVSIHRTENEWAIRQARLILAQRSLAELAKPATQDADLSMAMKDLLAMTSETNPLTAVRAAMTLVACGQVNQGVASSWLASPSENVRAWSVRASLDSMPIDDVFRDHPTAITVDPELLSSHVSLAKTDPSGLVRLALASNIQRLPVKDRAELAKALMSREEDANDHNLPLLVWYGLMPVAEELPSSLIEVAIESKWPLVQRLIARRLAEIMHKDGAPLESLINAITNSKDSNLRATIISGVSDAMKGWAKAPEPKTWKAFSASLKDTEVTLSPMVRELGGVFGDGRAMTQIRELVLDEKAEIGLRRSAFLSLLNQRSEDLSEICTKLIGDQRINTIAAKGLALDDNAENAKLIIKSFGRFRGTDRPEIIAAMVTRKSFASELVNAIAKGTIARSYLSAFDARQIRSFGDEELNKRLVDAWGETRESPEDRRVAMEKLRKLLAEQDPQSVNLSKGRAVFAELCGKCHRMYGEGQKIGPDLTGSNRSNLDYLVENIMDPSAVVQADYRVSVLMMEDGRILNGVVVSKNDRTLSLQTQNELLVIEREAIEEIKLTSQSPMPEGQLEQLSAAQIRDLFGYLRHPSQVELP